MTPLSIVVWFHRAFKALNDSLYNAGTRLTIARLEEEFRRSKEREVFAAEAERKDAENARQRVWNVALGGALFFLLLTAFLLFKVMRARVRTPASASTWTSSGTEPISR